MGCSSSSEVIEHDAEQSPSTQVVEGQPDKSTRKSRATSFAKSFNFGGSVRQGISFRAVESSSPVVDQQMLRATSLKRKQSAISVAEGMMLETQGKRFHDNYIRPTLVSYGGSCKVLTAYHKQTRGKFAVKIIPKDPRKLQEQRQRVMMEIGILREIEDHPNAIKLHEVYSDSHFYYLVMQCCDGGELFEHITKGKDNFTERHAAQILQSLMLFLAHIHSKGIVHMDIKPENIMFDSDGPHGVLKLIDFGAALHVQELESVKDAFGTVRYSSPEMALDSGIGHKTDIWSAAVVMYYLLSGQAPFLKQNDVDTLNYIKNKPQVRFPGQVWRNVSQAAKDCIKAMLAVDPNQRPSAQEVLQMPWLIEKAPSTTIIKSDILKHLRSFANQSRIRRLLLGLMASSLSGADANSLLNHFYCMDSDFSGTLEINELAEAAKKALPDLKDDEVENIFAALDLNETGTVDTREFFASLLHTMTPANQLVIAKKSFAHLDSNGQGYVNQKEFVEAMLRQAVSSGMSKEDAEQLYSELKDEFKNLDANNDGRLDFNEFKSILGLDEYSGFPSGASGKPPNLRSPSGKTSPSPQAKVEDNKAEENGQERTVSLNITQTPIAVPRSSSHHGSAAILRVALNIHDPGTTVSSGLSLSGFKSPSMPRVGFSPNLQPNFNSNEQEDASPTPSPFPFLAGGQVPGFVPSPNASIERQPSTKEQYLAKNNAMAAAAMTAAVAATRVVTSHSRSETEESFRNRSTSNLPTKVSEELPEDFAEDGSVVQRVSETMVLSPSGRWLSNVTASTRTLKKESSGDPFTEEIEGVTSQRNSRNQPLSTQGPSKQVSSKQGSFVRIQEPERIGVLPAEG